MGSSASHVRVTLEALDGAQVARVSGSAGFAEAEALERALAPALLQRPSRLILDLSELKFISSLAMGVLRRVSASTQTHGRAMMVLPEGNVREVMQRCRMLELFEQFASVESALSAA